MARKANQEVRAPFSSSSTSKAKGRNKQKTSGNGKLDRKPARKLDTSNAYTYLPSLPKRHRTSEATLSLSKEEAGPSSPRRRNARLQRDNDDDSADEEEGSDDDMEERVRKLAMKIAADDVAGIDPESEESEIDSDEAWASDGSDEERWGDVVRDLNKGKGKKVKGKQKEEVKKPAKPLTVKLDESDDEPAKALTRNGKGKGPASSAAEASGMDANDSDEDEDEAEDEEIDDEEDEFAADRSGAQQQDDDEEEEGDEAEDDDEEEEDDDEEADEAESEEELPSDLSDDEDMGDESGLGAFVDELDAADRKKRSVKGDTGAEAGKKKRRILPVSNGSQTGSGKLDISTLIASHPSLSSSSASALLPSKSDNVTASTSILKQGVLPAPLPTIVQERIDREAAYEKTKEEGQKWSAAMKRIKEAEHLSFPLQAKERGGVKSGGEVVATFKPETKLESAVTALLNKANLTDDAVTKHENDTLEAQDLSMEEIEERRRQLRMQRELMFRAEAKAKRIAKIKSKTFRKLARKRADKARQAGGDDEDFLDGQGAEEEREKAERARAIERATLRHGAKSKWAKDVGNDASELEDRRRAKEEMLDLKEKLQRKIMGRGDGESEEEEDEEDEDEEDLDAAAIKSRAFNQLSGLQSQDETAAQGGKGLMQMAFMKKAQDREMKRVAEFEQDLRRDIERYGASGDEDDEGESDDGEDGEGGAMMERVGGNEGRMVFAPAGNTNTRSAPASDPARTNTSAPTVSLPPRPALPSPEPDHNPWLNASNATSGPSRKRNTQVVNDKAARALKKSTAGREAALEEERVDIEVDGANLAKDTAKKTNKRKVDQRAHADDEGDAEDGEDGEDAMMPVNRNGVKGFKQRDLVAEAFAGDNVVEEFAQEKAKQIEADAPKTEDTSLPGWGSWAGKGLKKRKTNPKFLVTKPGLLPTQRKDFANSNVIITEKKDKKASQFLVKDLPYPYTSVAQYEASFNTPVGAEWNSRTMHRKETVPRVVKKPGAIIEPIRRLF